MFGSEYLDFWWNLLMHEWIVSLLDGASPSFVGAVSGIGAFLGSTFLKDVLIQVWRDRRADRAADRSSQAEAVDVFRNYSDPMLMAAISLFWRINELKNMLGRGGYLKRGLDGDEFDKYKFVSTVYRLASFLGWIRAYKKEVVYFSHHDDGVLASLTSALNEFEADLASGEDVEMQRLLALADIWNFELPQDKGRCKEISVLLDINVRRLASELGAKELHSLVDLNGKEADFVAQVAEWLAGELRRDCASSLRSQAPEMAMKAIRVRQAWLYRDYQIGIGDIMLQEAEGDGRRYEVKGFSEFESWLLNDHDDLRWQNRLTSVFEGLDFSRSDSLDYTDARLDMLDSAFSALMGVIEAMLDADPSRKTRHVALISEIQKCRDTDSKDREV